MNPARLYLVGLLLVVVGIVMVALGGLGSGSTSIGGAVFIGPFPVVFGSGPQSGLVALAALIICAVMVITLYLSVLLGRRVRGQVGQVGQADRSQVRHKY